MSRLYQTSSAVKYRKQYQKPQLEELGDLRTLTLGGSPGIKDSGSAGTRKPIGSLPQPIGFPPLPDGSIILPDGRIIPPNEIPNP